VERGEQPTTGSVVHDEYFARVHELQTDRVMAGVDERNLLMPLAQGLNLLPNAEPSHVIERLGKLVPGWPRLQMTIQEPDESGATVVMAPGQKPTPETTQLVKILGAAANAELKLAIRVKEYAERSRRLQELGRTLLASAPKDLGSQSAEQRKSIENELARSLVVLQTVADEAPAEVLRIRTFVRDVRTTLTRP
jgi:hypothetical protein